MTDFMVNLANNVPFTDIGPYVFDGNFAFEQKLDGERLAVIVNDGQVSGVNRRGIATPLHPAIIKALDGTGGHWIIDGEWIDQTFWMFDLPTAPNVEPRTPYSLRRESLDAIAPVLTERTKRIQLVPSHRTPEAKVALMRWVVEHHAEGIMVKDLRATYIGRRSNAMLKAKLIETVDCVVGEIGREGKHSIAVELLDEEGVSVDVGSVKVTGELLATLKPGDVIEVIYLYCTQERRLYQPRFGRVRTDKLATECTIDQLKFTDKSVLAIPLT